MVRVIFEHFIVVSWYISSIHNILEVFRQVYLVREMPERVQAIGNFPTDTPVSVSARATLGNHAGGKKNRVFPW